MNSTLLISLVLTLCVSSILCVPFAGSCDSCGRECQSACGTRGFRTCCLNYLKKRSTPIVHPAVEAQSNGERESNMELLMVLPELAEFYPSLGFLLPPDFTDQNQIKTYFDKKKETKQTDDAESDEIL